ncbi:hypothetical protein CRE_17298 [Caenorhabditis remanei]|uniref:Uncharacterized protein n=1 Tax=Caenorhabditis remanei TaxID=31234 RepID=E3MRZ8_CAERE|nr:hypothetical protein CRE_17298 [Caenorhabditis remanei]
MHKNAFYNEETVDSIFDSLEEADINSEELEKIGKDDISTSNGLQTTQTIHAAGGFLESSDEIGKWEADYEQLVENFLNMLFSSLVGQADMNSEELKKIGKDDMSTANDLQTTQTIHAAGDSLESSDEIKKLEGEQFVENFLNKLFSSLVGQADINSEQLEKIGKDDMSTSNGLQTTQKISAAGGSLESYDKIEKWEAEQLVENFWNKFLPGVFPCSVEQHDDHYPKSGSMFDVLNMNKDYDEDGKDME